MNLFNDGYLHHRLLYAFIGASVFSLLFKIVPDTYFQYFDKTNYYQIMNPIPVEKEVYKPCEDVNVTITRNSMIDGHGDSLINLSLVKESTATRQRVSTIQKTVSISQGNGTIIAPWPLACGIPNGQYYFEGTIKYEVRGVTKYTAFNTETFTVKGDSL